MARDTGPLTSSLAATLFNDPARTFTLTDAVATASSGIITYTATVGSADLRKILTPGSTVVITGFSAADLNFDDGNNRAIGTVGTLASTSKTRATIASVPSASTFTVVSPVAISDRTVSSATGTLFQDTAVANNPFDNVAGTTTTGTWLSSDSGNQVVAREWGNTNPIQPDTDRLGTTVALATSAPLGNGAQVTYTVSSHSFLPGQTVSIQGVVPDVYNYENITIAATTSTTIVVNATATAPVTSYTKGSIVNVKKLGGTQAQVASATGATATGSVKVLAFTTQFEHNLNSGQIASIIGSSNNEYNVQNAVVTTTGAKTFTVPAKTFTINKVSGTSGSGAVGDGTNVLYYTNAPHGYSVNDKVSIYGMAPTAYNVADGSVIAAGLTATSFAIANTATAAVTTLAGTAIKQSGTFSTDATTPVYVSLGDYGWNSTYSYPSGTLVAGLDNHDRVKNSDSSYPAFTPVYTAPYVLGAIQTPENPQAVRAFKAAGFTNVNAAYFTTSTGGSAISQVVYNGSTAVYTATAHGLVQGQVVNIPNVTGTAGNVTTGVINNAIISTSNTNTFTIASTVASATITGLTGQWFSPKGIAISSISATATAAASVVTVVTSTAHGLKANDTVGIAGGTSDVSYIKSYVPSSTTSTGVTVASIVSPTSFTYALPAAATSASPTVTGGLVIAYNGVVTAQSVTGTTTTPSTAVTISATPGPNGTGGGTSQSSYV
jgi:hypothetical protein